MEFIRRHLLPPYTLEQVEAFLGPLLKGPDRVFSLEREGERLGVAVLIDGCDNLANAADFALVAFRRDYRGPAPFDAPLETALRLAAARGRAAVEITTFDGSPLGADYLESRGFRRAFGTLLMEGEREMAGPRPLPGDHWVDVHPGNVTLYYDLLRRSFARNPETSLPPWESFRERALTAAIAPRLLFRETRPVGFLKVAAGEGGAGEVVTVGRDPELRGTGLGERLFAEALRVLGERGLHPFRLQVLDTNRPALALYERYGFRVVRTFHTYSRGTGTSISRKG